LANCYGYTPLVVVVVILLKRQQASFCWHRRLLLFQPVSRHCLLFHFDSAKQRLKVLIHLILLVLVPTLGPLCSDRMFI